MIKKSASVAKLRVPKKLLIPTKHSRAAGSMNDTLDMEVKGTPAKILMDRSKSSNQIEKELIFVPMPPINIKEDLAEKQLVVKQQSSMNSQQLSPIMRSLITTNAANSTNSQPKPTKKDATDDIIADAADDDAD